MQSLNLPVFPELGKGNLQNMNLNDIMNQNAAGRGKKHHQDKKETAVLETIEKYLQNESSSFFEGFTIENIEILAKTAKNIKIKYSKVIKAVIKFLQGLRAFLRFKISINQSSTQVDRLDQQKNGKRGSIQGGKAIQYIDLYKFIAPPALTHDLATRKPNLETLSKYLATMPDHPK